MENIKEEPKNDFGGLEDVAVLDESTLFKEDQPTAFDIFFGEIELPKEKKVTKEQKKKKEKK